MRPISSKSFSSKWFVRRILPPLLGIALLATLVVSICRFPISGTIRVSSSHSDRFTEIMKENGVILWTGIGALGMMHVRFNNPLTLLMIDDLVLEDAKKNNYQAVVEYRCLVPYFNRTISVERE
ncbi:hypothetical protein SH501x_003733 [Pirellulaceae bacterium SH501]|jgi:hypothetical protein